MKKKFLILISTSVLLLTGLVFMSAKIYKLNEIVNDKPQEIVIANITSTSAKILWKGDHNNIPKLSYKDVNSTGLYKRSSLEIFEDNISNKKIYIASIDDLDPNSEYIFEIDTKENLWSNNNDRLYSFNTKDLNEDPQIPNPVTGDSNPKSFVLVKTNDENYILNTQYHGTWALDISEDDDYEVSTYANYMTDYQLKEYSSNIFNISPVYALDGANCRMGASANYSGASKSNVERLATQWVQGCPNGHYASECYEDVICRASSQGVDPAFTLTIWLNESGASNYANLYTVQDFGINGGGIPNHNFDQQLDRHLSIISQSEGYLRNYSSCGYDQAIKQAQDSGSSIDPKLIVWAAVYQSGNGCNTQAGLTYITAISTVYNWVTNSTLTWPLTKSSSVGDCNFDSTLTGYNSCSSKGTDPEPNPNPSPNPTPSPGLKCGEYGCSTDSDCEGWNNGNGDVECNESSSHDPNDQFCERYRCPTGYKVGDDGCTCEKTTVEKVCCLTDGELETKDPDECSGTIQENLDRYSCKTSSQRISLEKGVNFISFDISPYNEEEKLTAHSLVSNNKDNILVVGEYIGDNWISLVVNKNNEIKGNDFVLEGQRAYLIITNEELNLNLTGFGNSPRDISNHKGWTLLPKDLVGKSSAKQIITSYEDLEINQVAVWDNSSSLFENLNKDVAGEFYGKDISLYNIDSLFVKIE